MPWPGKAGVSISLVVFTHGDWQGKRNLDGQSVQNISPHLESIQTTGTPNKIPIPIEKASCGTGILGVGFTVDPSVAEVWIKEDARYRSILFPYVNAKDVNSLPSSNFSRFVINFGERDEKEAMRFSKAYEQVKRLVKPQRDRLTRQIHEPCWWKHWDRREELYREAEKYEEVLVVPLVTKYLSFVFLPTGWIYSKELGVLPTDRRDVFGVYQSSFHDTWARRNSSTLETRLAYSFSDALRTFPVPDSVLSGIDDKLKAVGDLYHGHRNLISSASGEGLTKIYNRFHDESQTGPDFTAFRDLQVLLDTEIAISYGWEDIRLIHDFIDTTEGRRFSISEENKAEIMQRLFQLNTSRSTVRRPSSAVERDLFATRGASR